MLSISLATRVFVALNPVDMRRGFNGLYALIESVDTQILPLSSARIPKSVAIIAAKRGEANADSAPLT